MLPSHHDPPAGNPLQQKSAWHATYHQCQSDNPALRYSAYQQLRRLLLPHIRYRLCVKASSQAEADDCLQETLVDIWQNFAGQRGPTGQEQSFRSWCLTIANRNVLDLRRRPIYRRPEIYLDALDEEEPLRADLDLEAMIVYRLAIATLFQDVLTHPALTLLQRQVLWLHCVEELDYAEIAQRLQRNITTIRVNRHRAIIALQQDKTLMVRISALLDSNFCP